MGLGKLTEKCGVAGNHFRELFGTHLSITALMPLLKQLKVFDHLEGSR